MYSPEEVSNMIKQGKTLLLAGAKKVLKNLPKGNWIGGTNVYFMAENGGMQSDELILVSEIPSDVVEFSFKYYDLSTVKNVYKEGYENGFSIIIMPVFTKIHVDFAKASPQYEGFAMKPLAGWVSGTDLDKSGETAKVFLGTEQSVSEDLAVVAHFKLPKEKFAEITIINIWSPGNGDEIEFLEAGFEVKDVKINGKITNFVDYLINNKIDTNLPIVADYNGVMMNISFKEVNLEKKTASFFSTTFKNVVYKFGSVEGDYIDEVMKHAPKDIETNYVFSCNCLANYVGHNLVGKKTGSITGPATFGEIAYQLLNRTMVNLEIKNI